MMRLRYGLPLWLAAFSIGSFLPLAARSETPQPSVIGIDHMPLAVRNLEVATDRYRAMGFAMKPGRFHENGIRNNHVKFPDGAGIELITASESRDSLTARYRQLLAQGEGPASIAFHARNTERLVAALASNKIDYVQDGGLIRLRDPQFDFIFFVRDNRSPTDRPEHFTHANSAVAMTAVWIASDNTSKWRALMSALGAAVREETVLAPEPVVATVFAVGNGNVVLVPQSRQLMKGRPIVGATFRVTDLDALNKMLASASIQPAQSGAKASHREIFLPPASTYGIWLSFTEQ
jgi:hypothetical protein